MERIDPREAHARAERGSRLVDVRTVSEFEAGHPAGAFNVPWLIDGPSGRVENERFLAVMCARFAFDAPLVLSCHTANRSSRAAAALAAAGFTSLAVQRAGWAGATDAFGRVIEPGWKAAALPIETTARTGRSYAELAS
jgi:rhodanese-related sulfurtransferase